MSGDFGDAGDQVDGTAGYEHGWLTLEHLGGGLVDSLRSDGIDAVTVLGEGEVTEGHEVAGNLFEALVLTLEGHKDVHLEDVLGAGKFLIRDWLTELVELLEHHLHELSRVGSWTLDVHTEETGISEVRVDAGSGVNKVVLLHQVGDGTAVHALAWAARAEGGGLTDQGLHNIEGGDITVLPGDRLESERDVSLRALSPGAVLTTDVLGLLTGILMLRNTVELTKTLSDEVNVLTMALDTAGNNKSLLGGDSIHHELLHDAGIKVANVVLKTESWHTKSLVAVGSSEKEVLVVSVRVILAQVFVQIVTLLVLRSSNVSCKNRSWLKSTIDHHLEHVGHIVLNAVASEVGALLVIFHLHITSGHLDHTVVDSLVGVLQGLKIGVLKGEKGA